jgi:hypothetical protein
VVDCPISYDNVFVNFSPKYRRNSTSFINHLNCMMKKLVRFKTNEFTETRCILSSFIQVIPFEKTSL